MTSPAEEQVRIATEAAEWQSKLEREGAAAREAFVDWLRTSPRHVQEFLYMEALAAATDRVDAGRRIDVDRLLAQAQLNVVPLGPEPIRAAGKVSRWRRLALPLAAGLAVLAIGAGLVSYSRQSYTTTVGEQRAIELEDGSLVQLNAQSRIQLRWSEHVRDVYLFAGEALFTVTSDPERPFRVHAGEVVIRALGTQFNVNRLETGVAVSVLEGKVVLDDAQQSTLVAGEEAHVSNEGLVARRAADAGDASAWRQRRLVFRDETLADIAAEFNRYNRAPRLLVEGAARERRFGGTFDADDPQSITQVLAGNGALEIERTREEIRIRER